VIKISVIIRGNIMASFFEKLKKGMGVEPVKEERLSKDLSEEKTAAASEGGEARPAGREKPKKAKNNQRTERKNSKPEKKQAEVEVETKNTEGNNEIKDPPETQSQQSQ